MYDAGGVLRDVVTDHLGSTRAVVKAGSIVERDDYYPFGARHAENNLRNDLISFISGKDRPEKS